MVLVEVLLTDSSSLSIKDPVIQLRCGLFIQVCIIVLIICNKYDVFIFFVIFAGLQACE